MVFNWEQQPPIYEEFIHLKVMEELQRMIRSKQGMESFIFLKHCQLHWHYASDGRQGMTTPHRDELMKECQTVFALATKPDWVTAQDTPWKLFEFIMASQLK